VREVSPKITYYENKICGGTGCRNSHPQVPSTVCFLGNRSLASWIPRVVGEYSPDEPKWR